MHKLSKQQTKIQVWMMDGKESNLKQRSTIKGGWMKALLEG